jgi:hypothetical protein
LPVKGKQASEIAARAAFFLRMIERQTASEAFRNVEVTYHDLIHSVLAHVYFALSEAYKAEFLKPGSGTDPTKQAALTCAAICAVNPLRPIPGEKVVEEHLYLNPMLAMRSACAVIGHTLPHDFDAARRIYLQAQRFNFPSVKSILDEATINNGEIKTAVAITLTPDEEQCLKGLITFFVNLRDFSQQN